MQLMYIFLHRDIHTHTQGRGGGGGWGGDEEENGNEGVCVGVAYFTLHLQGRVCAVFWEVIKTPFFFPRGHVSSHHVARHNDPPSLIFPESLT